MRSASRWFYLVSLGVWGFLGLFLLFVVPSANAAGVTYATTRVGPGSYVPNGIAVPATVNVAPPGGVPRYQQVVPTMPKAKFGGVARAAVRGPAGLAAYGVIVGAGYLVDRATGAITKEIQNSEWVGTPSSDGLLQDVHYNATETQAQNICDNTSYEHCVIWDYEGGYNPLGVTVFTCTQGYAYIEFYAPNGRAVPRCSTTELQEVITTEIVPATEADYIIIDQALWDQLSLSEKDAIIRDAIITASPRGTVDTDNYPVTLTSSNTNIQNFFNEWPQARVAYQNMLNAEIAAWLASQDPEFQPSPDEQVIIGEGTETPPIDQSPTLEFPDFCTWASFICQPFDGGDHPEVPVLDLETPEYDSGLPGSGSCPQPIEVVTGFGSWQISFQPACDLALAIRLPLIAISYLTAAYIVVGVRK